MAASFGVAAAGDGLVERRRLLFGNQNTGVIDRQAVFGDEAGAFGVRQLRQTALEFRNPVLIQHERQEIGVGEVAVIVGVFLGAERAGLAAGRVEQPGLLIDAAAGLPNLDLALGLDVDGLHDVADRVDVLDLAAGAERLAVLADRDVDVGAHGALLHVAVAGAEIAQDGAHLAEVGTGLFGAAHVGLADDLHQATPERLRSM